jgi:Hemerythrin HHE cation binding domain
MNALELLKGDHQKVSDLFEQVKATGDAKKHARLFEQIQTELDTHSHIDETILILYPG